MWADLFGWVFFEFYVPSETRIIYSSTILVLNEKNERIIVNGLCFCQNLKLLTVSFCINYISIFQVHILYTETMCDSNLWLGDSRLSCLSLSFCGLVPQCVHSAITPYISGEANRASNWNANKRDHCSTALSVLLNSGLKKCWKWLS